MPPCTRPFSHTSTHHNAQSGYADGLSGGSHNPLAQSTVHGRVPRLVILFIVPAAHAPFTFALHDLAARGNGQHMHTPWVHQRLDSPATPVTHRPRAAALVFLFAPVLGQKGGLESAPGGRFVGAQAAGYDQSALRVVSDFE